jgi:dTDP-4-dehydrorhamnose reductase
MTVVLLTGASGFLGSHLYQYLGTDAARDRYGPIDLHGTYRRQPPPCRHGRLHRLDLTQPAAVADLWQHIRPQVVIHSAAWSKAHACEQDPAASYGVNVTATVTLAQRAAAEGIPFIFLSTGLVFGGDRAPYDEAAPPHPLNHYGRQKAAAEAQVLALYPAATVCRLPLLYGAATPTAQCFLQGFLQKLRQGQAIPLFTDEYRTPVAAADAAQGIVQMLTAGVTGIVHLGGPERLSRYGFGQIMARVFDCPTTGLLPTLRADVSLPAPRPGDTALDSRRAYGLGYRPRSVETALAALARSPHASGFEPSQPWVPIDR